jgi:endonuclease/exonuclease/phosphatase (EEP) superfamily protein YafD
VLLAASVIPGALVGLLAEDFIDTFFREQLLVICGLLVVGAGLLFLFVRRQRRLTHPLVDLRMFARPAFSTSVGCIVLAMLALVGLELIAAQYLQLVLGLSPLETGLRLLPLTFAAMAAGLVVPGGIAGDPAPPGGTELTVLELNAYEGAADVAAVAGIITRDRPDVVVLAEAGDRFRSRLAALVPGYRSWSNVPPGVRDVRGITVLSSPRAGDVVARPVVGDTRYPWAEVSGGVLGSTRLLAVHLVSVVPQWISYWPGELESLRRWCTAPGPLLVVGDLNASPDHSAFRAGTAGCTDAASSVGAGLTATWRAGVPRWAGTQIDHVLLRGGPAARDVRVLDVPGTDHRALLARVRL